MKKALSLILTLAMLLCMVTTFAAAENVVGTHGDKNTVEDGVESFTKEDGTSQNIDITVSLASVVHKYAVDVEYSTQALTIGGATLTWDVNTMTYVAAGSDTTTGEATKTITITNYSDLAVQAYAAVTDKDENDYLDVTSPYTETSKLTVEKAVAGSNGQNGTATTGTITITVAPEAGKSWSDVSAYYADATGEQTVTVATVTVYIEPDSTTD